MQALSKAADVQKQNALLFYPVVYVLWINLAPARARRGRVRASAPLTTSPYAGRNTVFIRRESTVLQRPQHPREENHACGVRRGLDCCPA